MQPSGAHASAGPGDGPGQPSYGQTPPSYGQTQPGYGPGQPGFGQTPSGYGQYGAGGGQPHMAQPDHPRTVLAFVLSIVGLGILLVGGWFILPVVVTLPLGILGVIFGRQARRDMSAYPGYYRNEGLATAAVVIGWITVGLSILALVVGLVLLLWFSVMFSRFGPDMMGPEFQRGFERSLQSGSGSGLMRWLAAGAR